jgi:hypothetical protein
MTMVMTIGSCRAPAAAVVAFCAGIMLGALGVSELVTGMRMRPIWESATVSADHDTSLPVLPERLATTGRVFSGERFRRWGGPKRTLELAANAPAKRSARAVPCGCSMWAIITTIASPSNASATPIPGVLAQGPAWCVVVVGDNKGPHNPAAFRAGLPAHLAKRVTVLSAAEQTRMFGNVPFVRDLPWNTFARKNVGYLFAVGQGAEMVLDLDDDNMLKGTSSVEEYVSEARRRSIPAVHSQNVNWRGATARRPRTAAQPYVCAQSLTAAALRLTVRSSW